MSLENVGKREKAIDTNKLDTILCIDCICVRLAVWSFKIIIALNPFFNDLKYKIDILLIDTCTYS